MSVPFEPAAGEKKKYDLESDNLLSDLAEIKRDAEFELKQLDRKWASEGEP